MPASWFRPPAELAVPVWAERATPTTWHPRHIGERYGLFTLIVLRVRARLDPGHPVGPGGGRRPGRPGDHGRGRAVDRVRDVVVTAKESVQFLTSLRAGIVWGYGHYLVFGLAAAVGAGLAVNVDFLTHQAAVGPRAAAAAFTIPVALFLVAVGAAAAATPPPGPLASALVPGTALLVLASTLTAEPILVTGLLVAAMIAGSLVILHRPADREAAQNVGRVCPTRMRRAWPKLRHSERDVDTRPTFSLSWASYQPPLWGDQFVGLGRAPGARVVRVQGGGVLAEHRVDHPPLRLHHVLTGEQLGVAVHGYPQQPPAWRPAADGEVGRLQLNVLADELVVRSLTRRPSSMRTSGLRCRRRWLERAGISSLNSSRGGRRNSTRTSVSVTGRCLPAWM